jgi:glycosyltransferase involved in cell wall biosynthesis
MDRLILFQKMHELHKKKKKVIVAGKNWSDAFEWASFVQPHVDHPSDIYEKSFITVHNNTHGLGIHSRVLEAMAVGSFVMMHPSPHSRLPGGMDSTFEPDVNYGLYSADNFVEKVEEWLADDERRKKAITENKKILLSKHLWQHRAEQILNDLK